MRVCVLMWLELMCQGSKFRSGTHTLPKHTLLIQYLWLTQPPERKKPQHATLSQPVQVVLQHEAVFCSSYVEPFFWHRMHVLHWSTFVSINCLLLVDVELTQDVAVKKRHVEVLSCTIIKQTFSFSLCYVTCLQYKPRQATHQAL